MPKQPPIFTNTKMPDGTIRQFDAANEPNPASVGNESREGFLYSCYFHHKGKIFQTVVKGAIMGMIRKIHDDHIPAYDPQAYVYDDDRLRALDRILKSAVMDLICDNDAEHKRAVMFNLIDICLFMLKEDAYYRPRILKGAVDVARGIIAHEGQLTTFTDYEQYNLARFNNNGHDHEPDFSDMPMEERLKLPKKWTGLP